MANKPIELRNGWALWYSPDDNGYYWQDKDGYGDKTSNVYASEYQAGLAITLFVDSSRWAEGE